MADTSASRAPDSLSGCQIFATLAVVGAFSLVTVKWYGWNEYVGPFVGGVVGVITLKLTGLLPRAMARWKPPKSPHSPSGGTYDRDLDG